LALAEKPARTTEQVVVRPVVPGAGANVAVEAVGSGVAPGLEWGQFSDPVAPIAATT
jgi:hypothetical protein